MKYQKLLALAFVSLSLAACDDDDNDQQSKNFDYSAVPAGLQAQVAKAQEFKADADLFVVSSKGDREVKKDDVLKGTPGYLDLVYADKEHKNFKGALLNGHWSSAKLSADGDMVSVAAIRGYLSTPDQFKNNKPKKDKATYRGSAYALAGAKEVGTLNYSVNFDKKEGSGSIEGIKSFSGVKNVDRIMLSKEKFKHYDTKGSVFSGQNQSFYGVMDGKAKVQHDTSVVDDGYKYSLAFFGDKANEITGYVSGKDGKKSAAFTGVRHNNN